MSVSSPDRPSIEDLAEEFLDRRRRGERPTLEEYATRYPDLAVEIREFFPVLGLVEDFKPGTRRRQREHRRVRTLLGLGQCWSGSAIFACCVKSDGAEWGSCTRPSKNRWAVAWP